MTDNTSLNPGTDGDLIATDDIDGVKFQRVKLIHGADGVNDGDVAATNAMPVTDYWMEHAKQVIFADYGVSVSVEAKNKDLLKFGRNELVGTSSATVMTLPAGILNETYVSSNLINSIISTAAGDTEIIAVEGHTSADGLTFVFVTQEVTLTGQTVVALGTPLCRVSRAYNTNGTEITGVVSITETDTYASGVPATDTKVHLQIDAGKQQSDKAATTISSTDYWVITGIYGDYLKKTAGFAEVNLEMRLSGKVFRHRVSMGISDGASGSHDFKPYFICPANADIRLVAKAGGASTPISGGIQGVLLK